MIPQPADSLTTGAPKIEDTRVDAELEEMLYKLRTNVKIVGVGGGGSNTIARIYGEGVVGAELYAANTDAQHLLAIRSPKKILLGRRSTRGLGAGALPQVGEEAAREAEEELRAIMSGADMVFVTCGLGGGTGTGGSGYVARLAKDVGDQRAQKAIDEAINSPLLEVDISGATGVLVNVTGGSDMSIGEAERVAEVVQSRVSQNARIIWGASVDPALEHTMRVMLVATGVKSKNIMGRKFGFEGASRAGVDLIQ